MSDWKATSSHPNNAHQLENGLFEWRIRSTPWSKANMRFKSPMTFLRCRRTQMLHCTTLVNLFTAERQQVWHMHQC